MPSDSATEARERVIEAFGRAAEVYGASRSVGRVYGRLFFADGPVSLDELVERTGYAKSTVSTATSTLTRFHLVRRRSLEGEGKRAFYEANRDFWTALQRFLDDQVSKEVRMMQDALAEAETTLSGLEDEQAHSDLARVRELRRTYDRAERALSVLSRLPTEQLQTVVGELGGTDKR